MKKITPNLKSSFIIKDTIFLEKKKWNLNIKVIYLFWEMMNKKILFFIGMLIGISPLATFANSWKNHDRQEISSCIDFNKQIKQLLKYKALQEEEYEIKKTYPLFFNTWETHSTSTTFIPLYDKKNQILTIVQWPKEPGNSLINLNAVKKIAKIRLPKSFYDVSVQFFWEKLLLISASQKVNNKDESLLLIYEISNAKLAPVHLFKQTGKIAKIHLQNEKFYLISVDDISKTTLENVVKHKVSETELFPLLEQGLSYGLPLTWSKSKVCRGLKYFFDDKLPKAWSFLVVDLNIPTQEKEHYTLFWNFEDLVFSQDFLYTSQHNSENQTLIQRFSLEPKLNYQKSSLLSGILLNNGILPRGSKSSIITTLSSGKFNRYQVTNFDAQFSEVGSKELLSGNLTFDGAELIGDMLFFTHETGALLATRDLGKGSSPASPELSFEWWEKFLLNEKPFSFLEIEENDGKISFSFFEEEQWKLKKIKTLFYQQGGKLLETSLWDREKKILFLPTIKEKDLILRGFSIDENQYKIKEVFARKYPWTSTQKINMENFSEFSYAIIDNYLDIFLPNQAEKMKILKW